MPSSNWSALAGQYGNDIESDFEPLPVGKYTARVVEAEVSETSTGKVRFKCRLEVEDVGPHQGKTFFNGFVVSPESEAAMKIFFRHMAALGLGPDYFAAGPSDEQVAADLIDKRGVFTIKHREYNGNTYEDVKGIKPAGNAAPAAAPSPAPAAGQAPAAPF